MKYIFPALNQNEETVNKKLSIYSNIGLIALFFIIVPFVVFEVSKIAFGEQIQPTKYIPGAIAMYGAYFVNCYFHVFITFLVDILFFKTTFSIVHFARVLLPIRLLYIYLEIIFNTFIPEFLVNYSFILLNIWFHINMFIALRLALNYSKIQSGIPTSIYAAVSFIGLVMSW